MTKAQLKKTYEEEIKKIVTALRTYNPERIILFGSAVQGSLSEDSDIDLFLIKKVKSGGLIELGKQDA